MLALSPGCPTVVRKDFLVIFNNVELEFFLVSLCSNECFCYEKEVIFEEKMWSCPFLRIC